MYSTKVAFSISQLIGRAIAFSVALIMLSVCGNLAVRTDDCGAPRSLCDARPMASHDLFAAAIRTERRS